MNKMKARLATIGVINYTHSSITGRRAVGRSIPMECYEWGSYHKSWEGKSKWLVTHILMTEFQLEALVDCFSYLSKRKIDIRHHPGEGRLLRVYVNNTHIYSLTQLGTIGGQPLYMLPPFDFSGIEFGDRTLVGRRAKRAS